MTVISIDETIVADNTSAAKLLYTQIHLITCANGPIHFHHLMFVLNEI